MAMEAEPDVIKSPADDRTYRVIGERARRGVFFLVPLCDVTAVRASCSLGARCNRVTSGITERRVMRDVTR